MKEIEMPHLTTGVEDVGIREKVLGKEEGVRGILK